MARKSNGGPRVPFSASSQSTTTKAKHSRANRASKNDPSNAYVYEQALPKRHRTSEQQLSLSRDESKAGPSSPRRKSKKLARGDNDGEDEEDEDEEEESMEERIRKLQMMIAGDEPGQIDPDSEESEIDSDEAWASDGSDEDRWGDVFRDLQKDKSKTKKAKGKEVVKKPAKPLTVDLNESDDEEPALVVKGNGKARKAGKQAIEEEEDEDDEDMEDEDLDAESEDEFAVDRAGQVSGEDDEDEDEDDEDEEMDGSDDDDDDDDDQDLSEAELPSDLSDDEDQSDTLNGLDSFIDTLDAADQKKRQTKDVKAEVAKTKRRVLPVSSGPTGHGTVSDGKLDLSTLIASHPSLAGASALLPSKSDSKSSSSILKQGVLPAPLPTIVQDRLDREAAYEKTKEEGQKWSGAMKRIKEAEHLQFPLQAKDRGGVKSSGEVIGSFKAQNQFEDAITSLLNKANLTESEMTKREDEDLQGQELSMEEIKARRDNLRYQRELMFRAETKAKRVAKIKSKTYRKLARKRASKDGGGQIDLEDLERLDPEAAAMEREKLERDRARERATLRHGAKSGRWASNVGGDGELEERRRAKEDMLELKERLQRKIMGQDEGASSDEDEDDDDDEDEDADEDSIRAKAFDQLKALDKDPEAPAKGGKKGLMEMAFMKKAQDREMKRVAEEEKEARRDIERYGRDSEDDEESSGDEEETMMERVGGNEGRMVFTSTNAPSADTEQDGTRDASLSPQPEPSPSASTSRTAPQPFKSALSQPPPASNPWLAATSSAGPSRKKNAQVTNDKASRTLAKSAHAKEAALEDERVDIDIDTPLVSAGEKKRKGGDEDDESGEEEDGMLPTGLKGFKQRDLVAEAFAGDNVVQDFNADKKRQIEADAPKTENTSLTGWGSWGGKGVKKRKTNPKFLVKTAGIEPSKRKDFESSNVIITEKKDKRAAQFQVKDLPYPYTSVEQYEARFKTPVGSEWNSRAMHQKETMPRVTKKPGAIIEPIRKLF